MVSRMQREAAKEYNALVKQENEADQDRDNLDEEAIRARRKRARDRQQHLKEEISKARQKAMNQLRINNQMSTLSVRKRKKNEKTKNLVQHEERLKKRQQSGRVQG